jgi:hypothetical protein
MIGNFLKKSEWHLYLAIVFISLQSLRLYDNFSQNSIVWFLILLLISIVFIWLFQRFIWRRFFNGYPSILLLATFCTFCFLLWEPVSSTLRILFGSIRERYLIIFIGFVVLLLAYLSYRFRARNLSREILYLNILLLTFSIVEVYQIFNAERQVSPSVIGIKSNIDSSRKPDIFLILLDGYTKPETTPRYFGFENKGLADSLSKKGFYIVRHSKSNYKLTYQTIGSALNLAYLSTPLPETFTIFKSINDNFFVKTALAFGYRIRNLSIFAINGKPSQFLVKSYAPTSLEYPDFVLSRTLIASFFRKMNNVPLNDRKIHENSMQGFRLLDKIASDTANVPQFVYLHSLICHGPFWMDSTGAYSEEVVNRNLPFTLVDKNRWFSEPLEKTNLEDVKTEVAIVKDYQTHLMVANKLTLNSVNKILKNKPNSIVMVMSDHGFRFLMRHSPEETQAEQYANFCAVYFPGGAYEGLKSDMTPINVFRAVYNKAFGTSLEYLPNISGL